MQRIFKLLLPVFFLLSFEGLAADNSSVSINHLPDYLGTTVEFSFNQDSGTRQFAEPATRIAVGRINIHQKLIGSFICRQTQFYLFSSPVISNTGFTIQSQPSATISHLRLRVLLI